jgi:hypothetical protein
MYMHFFIAKSFKMCVVRRLLMAAKELNVSSMKTFFFINILRELSILILLATTEKLGEPRQLPQLFHEYKVAFNYSSQY